MCMVCGGDTQSTAVTFRFVSQHLAYSSLSTLSWGVSKHKGLPSSPQPHLAPTVFAWELQLQQGFPVLVAVPEDRVTYTLGFHKTQVSSGWLVSTFPFFMKFAVLSSECCWPLHQLFLLIAPSPSPHCSYGTSPSCFKDTQVYFIGVWTVSYSYGYWWYQTVLATVWSDRRSRVAPRDQVAPGHTHRCLSGRGGGVVLLVFDSLLFWFFGACHPAPK